MIQGKRALFFYTLLTLMLCATVSWGTETSKIYVNGQWVAASAPASSTNPISGNIFPLPTAPDLARLAQDFLQGNSALLGANAHSQWHATLTEKGEALQSQRLQKVWYGLPVVGADAVVQFAGNRIVFANADNTPLDGLSPLPAIRPTEAEAMAFASYRGRAYGAEPPRLEVLVLGTGREKQAHLVYEVTVHDRDELASDVHFIDAQTAQEVLVTSNVQTLRNRQVSVGRGDESDFSFDESQWQQVYGENGCSRSQENPVPQAPSVSAPLGLGAKPSPPLPAPCSTVDAQELASAQAAWNNTGLVYNYYKSVFHRDSIDGNGMEIHSIVNFGGSGFQNAAWYNEKSIMLYGAANDPNRNDFALPLDVSAHELTHGITARTANLLYASESGALNESYSDVFGKLVAFRYGRASDWKIGEELFKDGHGFIRDMENPDVANASQLLYRNDLCSRINDFCGVHANSGIPSRAAVLIAKKIGLDKLGKIYYLTLTQLLRSNSDFREAKAQTEAACATLYGQDSPDCAAVSAGFAAVGIGD